MSKRNSNTLVGVICYILVVLLIFGFVAVAYRLTDGFNEDIKTMYLEYNGEKILSSESSLALEDGDNRFDVKYLSDLVDKDEYHDFTVQVVVNLDESSKIQYEVGDGDNVESHTLLNNYELTDGFTILKYQGYFVLHWSSDTTYAGVLENLYPGKTVNVKGDDSYIAYPFALIVTSYNSKVSYRVNFGMGEEVSSIKLNSETIVF
jgi:hypothetical protein